MDLNKLSTKAASQAGAVLILRHPATDDATDISLTLAGADSQRYRSTSHIVQNRSLKSGKFKTTAEKLESNALEILAACVISWENVVDSELFPSKDKNAVPECNEKNALAFFKKHIWAKEQADTFIADRANFLPK